MCLLPLYPSLPFICPLPLYPLYIYFLIHIPLFPYCFLQKLHAAISAGNLEAVKKIVEEGNIKINARDSFQNTPLHSAIIADKFEISLVF